MPVDHGAAEQQARVAGAAPAAQRRALIRSEKEAVPMFDLDRFKAECSAAVTERAALQAVREVVARAVEDPEAVLKALREPVRSEVQTLHRSTDLTILNVIWGPRMTVMPHNHEMWAVIGIYTGREDNILWRRLPADPAVGAEPPAHAVRPRLHPAQPARPCRLPVRLEATADPAHVPLDLRRLARATHPADARRCRADDAGDLSRLVSAAKKASSWSFT